MNNYLPFKPIKGQAFRLYFSTNGLMHARDSGDPFAPASSLSIQNSISFATIGASNFKISKDGGSLTQTSNAPVEISTSGRGYVDLTTTEMNADVIVFSVTYNSSTYSSGYQSANLTYTIIIYTISSELSSAPTKDSSIAEKITALFQYFFAKRTVTASAETLYKDDGTTVLGSNTISDNGTVVTKGKIS